MPWVGFYKHSQLVAKREQLPGWSPSQKCPPSFRVPTSQNSPLLYSPSCHIMDFPPWQQQLDRRSWPQLLAGLLRNCFLAPTCRMAAPHLGLAVLCAQQARVLVVLAPRQLTSGDLLPFQQHRHCCLLGLERKEGLCETWIDVVREIHVHLPPYHWVIFWGGLEHYR